MVRSASHKSSPATGTLTQEIRLTPPPADDLRDPQSPPSFWEELNRIQDHEWGAEDQKGYKVYLYDNEARGKYLAVIFQPFDIEWVRLNYGGGSYKALLNDASGKIVCREVFAIDGDPRRKPPQSTSAAPAVAQPQQDSVVSQFINIMREEQQETRRLLREAIDRGSNGAGSNGGAMDPMRQFEVMGNLFSSLLGKLTPAPQPQMGIMEIIALAEKLRGPDLLQILSQAKDAGIINGAGGGDLVTQFTKLKEAAELMGFTAGEGKSWAQTLIEKGPEILDAGTKMIDKYKSVEETRLQTARTVAVIQQQRGAVITPQPGQAAAVPQHVPPQTPPPGGAVLEVEPVQRPQVSDQVDQIAAAAEKQLALIKGKVVEMILAGRTGDQIVEALDSIDARICDGFQGFNVKQLTQVFTEDPLLHPATQSPRFAEVMQQIVECLESGAEQEVEQVRPN